MQTVRKLLLVFAIVFPNSVLLPAHGILAQTADTTGTLPRGWLKAARLLPGELLSVQQRFARTPTLCTLVWIDNTALACDAATLGGPSERIVFPASQVYSVAKGSLHDCQEDCGESRRMLTGALIGAAVGGLIFGQNSGRAGAFGAMLGAGAGGAFAAGQGFGPQARPSLGMRVPLRRPLFFRVR